MYEKEMAEDIESNMQMISQTDVDWDDLMERTDSFRALLPVVCFSFLFGAFMWSSIRSSIGSCIWSHVWQKSGKGYRRG